MSISRAIILPPNDDLHGWTRRPYRPNCSQYNHYPGGEILTSRDGFIQKGNCSSNAPGTAFDFVCYNINGRTYCHASNGRQTNSYQQICCPQAQQQPPRSSCCRGDDYNACALCLDRKQGVSDAASHFTNMQRCRRSCGLF